MKNLYQILGVKKTDDKEEIKKSYRKKSMKAHPDQGGNAEEFDTINKAYRVLINDENRAKYDAGENIENILRTEKTKEQKIMEFLAPVFFEIIMSGDPSKANILNKIKANLTNQIHNITATIYGEEVKRKRFETVIKKIKIKNDDQQNIFAEIAKSQIVNIDAAIKSCEQLKKDLTEALNFLDDYFELQDTE